jgi:hypothetical protein
MNSDLGKLESVFSMDNIDFIDKASYAGNVILEKFDLGAFLERKDLGKISMNIDVDGKGFTEKYLNTGVKEMLLK